MIATHGKCHFGLTKARLCVLASLSGIPSFDPEQVEWLSTSDEQLGSGQFGNC